MKKTLIFLIILISCEESIYDYDEIDTGYIHTSLLDGGLCDDFMPGCWIPDSGDVIDTDTQECTLGCRDGSFVVRNEMDALYIYPWYCIRENFSITNTDMSLFVFDQLKEIGGRLTFVGNKFEDLSCLPNLRSIHLGIDISNNPNLKTLDGMDRIEWFGLNIKINNNPKLPYCEICKILSILNVEPKSLETIGNLGDECYINNQLFCYVN